MEKFPSNHNARESGIVRILGVDEDREKELLKIYKDRFDEDNGPHDSELEHSPELDQLIRNVNIYLQDFLKLYQVESVFLEPKHVQLIDVSKITETQEERLAEEDSRIGVYHIFSQKIILLQNYTPGQRIAFAHTLVHEMMHFNSVQYLEEVESKDGEPERYIRRQGFNVFGVESVNGETGFLFNNLDEAVVEELTIRFEKSYFSRLEQLEEEYVSREKMKDEIRESDSEEVINLEEILAVKSMTKLGDGGITVISEPFAYPEYRRELNTAIDYIYAHNQESFNSKEEVFNLFAQAVLVGDMLPLARVVEKTYGPGSFRRLGEWTAKTGY